MKKWIVNECDDALASDIKKKCDLSMLAVQTLLSRGYKSFDEIVAFFNNVELEEPFVVADMQAAVDAIMNAVDSYELICVYGDYDCDGITSTTLLFDYLQNIGANVMYYIPERDAGYGINNDAVKMLADSGVKLVVTVDNGISALSEADEIYKLGMKLVVTDHHQPGENLPRAEAVVNPHRKDCPSQFKELAGVGVAFKLCAALDDGSYHMVSEQYSELVALGTVADVVSLTGENRACVREGLKLLKNTENYGLKLLMEKTGCNMDNITATTLAFGIAPRINASGRFGSPLIAVKALLSEGEDAEDYVDTLVSLNSQRKDTEAGISQEILEYINSNASILNDRVLVISGKGWHHGVIGIVASRLLDYYSKPVVLISVDEDGNARGSARSVKGFNIYDCFSYCSDVLEKFGGHECAGGFSLKDENVDLFKSKILEYANSFDSMPAVTLTADKLLTPQDFELENVRGLSRLEPFGAGNTQPLFAIICARVDNVIPLSQGKHTKIDFIYGSIKQQALVFGQSPASLGFVRGDVIDMLCTLDINEYNGRESVSVKVSDCRRHGVNQDRYFAAKDAYEKYMRGDNLPQAFLQKIVPSRVELVNVYKLISQLKGITLDKLYSMLDTSVYNYCKLHLCIDIFESLKLLSYQAGSGMIKFIPVSRKVDIEGSEVLVRLRNKLN